MSDPTQLIRAIADGDRNAFQELYTLFSEKVYNTALSYTQNEQDAEEVAQDVFTSIFKNAKHFKENATVSTWVYRITVNTSLNLLKKRKRRFAFISFGDSVKEKPDFVHPGILMEHQESAKALFKVIDGLALQQKTAFILSFIEDLPRQEVADIMGLSLKAVESLLQRSKRNLREKLEKLYPDRRKKK